MPIPHIRYSFENGLKKLTVEDYNKARPELFNIMCIHYRSEFSKKKKDYRDIPHHIYVAITQIFERYGISEADVWTLTLKNDERAKKSKRG